MVSLRGVEPRRAASETASGIRPDREMSWCARRESDPRSCCLEGSRSDPPSRARRVVGGRRALFRRFAADVQKLSGDDTRAAGGGRTRTSRVALWRRHRPDGRMERATGIGPVPHGLEGQRLTLRKPARSRSRESNSHAVATSPPLSPRAPAQSRWRGSNSLPPAYQAGGLPKRQRRSGGVGSRTRERCLQSIAVTRHTPPLWTCRESHPDFFPAEEERDLSHKPVDPGGIAPPCTSMRTTAPAFRTSPKQLGGGARPHAHPVEIATETRGSGRNRTLVRGFGDHVAPCAPTQLAPRIGLEPISLGRQPSRDPVASRGESSPRSESDRARAL